MIVLAAMALSAIAAHSQWAIQNSNSTASLRGIHSLGGGVAWASGTNGTVLRTEDGGYLWQTCTIPPGAEKLDFRGIQAFDANTAIVMSSGKGDLSRLYKTTDGCHSWKLVFSNPDKDGFWDAIQFNEPYRPSQHFSVQHANGVLVGDPVDGLFAIFVTHDGGDNWSRWNVKDTKHPPRAAVDEALFAASNQAATALGSNGPFALVTGGPKPHLYVAEPHSPFDVGSWWSLSSISLPFAAGQSAGAFALAAKRYPNSPFADFVVVGGDYTKPDAPGNAAYIVVRPSMMGIVNGNRIVQSTQTPHGFRSAVAYDAATKAWITVGPNGTDISTEDGKNWRAVGPNAALNEPADADKNWNALSLPFVVGPHGRIGRLNDAALKAALAAK